MGFLKDFKDDFSQAVNELIPDDNNELDSSDQMVNTLDSEVVAIKEEAENEMKEWLEEFTQDDNEENIITEADMKEETHVDDSSSEKDIYNDNISEEIFDEMMEDEIEDMDENVDLELLDALNAEEEKTEDKKTEDKKKTSNKKVKSTSVINEDDVTVISKGTTIVGSISTDGSLDIMGSITGDVECLGKLSITGKIIGDSTAAEVYINTERLEGSINSEGSVKVGLGTVVVGDIIATSGVIAGAVKGEIDINGPIVIDSTAIIKGNIKAKSVQINNGAVVEGFCSLSYSDVDLDNVFD